MQRLISSNKRNSVTYKLLLSILTLVFVSLSLPYSNKPASVYALNENANTILQNPSAPLARQDQEITFTKGFNSWDSAAIDGNLNWNTFLPDGGEGGGYSIATDKSGNIYVTGNGIGAPVDKLNSSGNLVWQTYLGQNVNGNTSGMGITVDADGNVYVTGMSGGNWGNPVRPYTPSDNGQIYDGFVAKLDSSGNLMWNTFLGGSENDIVTSIAVGTNGNIYVTGGSADTWGNPIQAFGAGSGDAFIANLNSSGQLIWNTFFGGSNSIPGLSADGFSLALDANENIYVTGGGVFSSSSPQIPFVAKFNSTGNLIWNTLLGGGSWGNDSGFGVALDTYGNVYVSGYSSATWGNPILAFNSSSSINPFAAKLDTSGNLVWNTFLGPGSSGAYGGITLNDDGRVSITGTSGASWGNPIRAYTGSSDAFVASLDSSTGNLVWNTFLGGSGMDEGNSIALDNNGSIYVTGLSNANWGNPIQPWNSGHGTFVAKLNDPTWTIMVYLDGDNSLVSSYFNVFNQLEDAANNPNVNIVVAWDNGGNNSAYYAVQYDTDLNHLATYTEGVNRWSKGDLDMSNSTTLSDFIQWAQTNYSAQHYALFISDHGTGLTGTALDNSNGGHWLTINELGSALSTATSNGSNKLDVVFADSCLMGMIEDEYQIRNYANVYIASENLLWIPSGGASPYSNYISAITSATTPQILATEIVNNYASWLNNAFPGRYGYTLSAVDLTQIDPLVNAVGSLATALQAQMATYSSQIQTERNAAQKFDSNGNSVIDDSDEYVDLADLASELKNLPDTAIQNAAQSVIDTENNYVITNTAKSGNTYPALDSSRIHGVSIFAPTGNLKRNFYTGLNLDFASGAVWGSGSTMTPLTSDTLGWGPFLVNYVESVTPNAMDDPNPPDLASPAEAGFTISGNTGVSGITLSYTDGATKIAKSDGNGNYSFTVSSGWSGTVTPSGPGYNFSPIHIDYSNVLADQTHQDYTSTTVASFADVPGSYWAWSFIERLYGAGITGGCSTNPLSYCPDNNVTRDQMAVFLERGMHSSSFNPPTGSLTFTDTAGDFAQYWIEALKSDGITSGCGTDLYCPTSPTTRAQMAIFLLKSEHGAGYTPPPATGTKFTDVPASYWAASWIEQLANEGITSGCGTNLYCPDQSVTRAQMAVFLVKTFNLP